MFLMEFSGLIWKVYVWKEVRVTLVSLSNSVLMYSSENFIIVTEGLESQSLLAGMSELPWGAYCIQFECFLLDFSKLFW
jgi:hypothetical protein